MRTGRPLRCLMPKAFFTTLLPILAGGCLAGTGAAVAEMWCYPHCDYVHYYGPYDFTYDKPGLYGYPQCGPQGDCAPNLAYRTSIPIMRRIPAGRITVRLPRLTTPQQP
jgi:hypothetical protein